MKIKQKRNHIKLNFQTEKFLKDQRLNPTLLSERTGVSRFVFLTAIKTGMITISTYIKLKEVFTEKLIEQYITE